MQTRRNPCEAKGIAACFADWLRQHRRQDHAADPAFSPSALYCGALPLQDFTAGYLHF